jgi:hypothetical protein
MPRQSKAQKETVERVMHEYKHGELGSSRGKKVKNPKQAIAIALHEAGASKYESPAENRENLRRSKARERQGATEKDKTERTASRRRTGDGRETSRAELYAEAKRRHVPGRSKMDKGELKRALHM